MAKRRTATHAVERRWTRLALPAILLAGLTLRLALTPFGMFKGDYGAYRAWALRLVSVPLRRFYAVDEHSDGVLWADGIGIDHLPGDLWIHWLLARLYQQIYPDMDFERFAYTFMLKLVPSLADVGVGLFLFLIARLLAGRRAGLIAAALYMFNPGPIFLSATWGQWDSVSAMVVLAALWLALRGTPQWSLPVLTYACLIKPQFIFLLPLFAIVWWRGGFQPAAEGATPPTYQQRLRRLLPAAAAALAVFLAVTLPFSVGFPPLPTRWTIVERISTATGAYTIATLNAYNLWALLVGDSRYTRDDTTFLGINYQYWAIGLLFVALALIVVLFWRRTTREMLVWATLATTLALFVLPTRIHERYLLPALILAILLAAINARLIWIAGALSLTYFANLVLTYRIVYPSIFGEPALANELLMRGIALTNVVVFGAVLLIGAAFATEPVTATSRGPAGRSPGKRTGARP